MNPLAISIKAAAELLDISRMGVYRLMRRGELPYTLVGRRRRVRMRDLEAYLNRHEATVARDARLRTPNPSANAQRKAGGQ